MRHIIYILLFLATTTVFGQPKDRRAVLGIGGRVNEISVSPDEKIWLVTALGNVYYTVNMDSIWHEKKTTAESTEKFGFGDGNLQRISFFNRDTAIMTGYLSENPKEKKRMATI